MTTPHRRAAEEIDADNLDGGTCGDPYVLDETEKTLLKHFPPLVWSREVNIDLDRIHAAFRRVPDLFGKPWTEPECRRTYLKHLACGFDTLRDWAKQEGREDEANAIKKKIVGLQSEMAALGSEEPE